MTPDVFTGAWFSALASIVVIDLILAGDNAIVIGLAARNVPRDLQRRVILWGTAGAIIVRALLTEHYDPIYRESMRRNFSALALPDPLGSSSN